jgi:drug/metabolite transporter (DMT)-like permease
MMAVWCGPALTNEHLRAVFEPPVVWLALYAVIPATVFTYCLNTWALRHTSGSQVALYINVQPLVAAAVNMATGAELPGSRFFGALALVAFGLWLQARAPAAPRAGAA